jgi:hypothetical protein
VATYLEIALRAVTPVKTPHEQRAEARQEAVFAPCGSPHCAGCYEVAPGVRIHPPKCGEDYREWLERWEAKSRLQ